ncbi:cobra venom factor-like [Stylophora pistillata]|uniref:Complement C3 n=1 Tax=Stylophora pistillata TaxID=50429 RepID=A0A2B4SDI9_STYPI|nr:cobra venom factor-like [Stylophora pistillata]PFX26602.1 Complement C3 [Stylophora pistillata]
MTNVVTAALRFAIFLLGIGCTEAKRFSIIAPSVFHIGVEENVSVAVYDAMQPVTVKLYLQDYPFRRKTFSPTEATLQPGKGSTSFLTVKVEPENLPNIKSVDVQYVYLVAKSDDGHFQFHKEAKILLSYKNGMVFIQTDKPIYTPKQKVLIRVFPLQFNTKPSGKNITLMVLNPQGVKVKQWKDLETSTGIISQVLLLSNFIILGNWTVTAIYGHQNIYNTSVQFEVREYVLPKFSVKLQVPPYILKTDKEIKVQLTARYTYGEPVVGAANVYLSIALKGKVIPIATHQVLLGEGTAAVEERVKFIKERAGEIWFPEGGRLHVQADVIERATGEKETAVDKSSKFTSNPYLVEIIDTPKYFKPGMPFTVKVVVTLNEKPAESITVTLSATGKSVNEEKHLTKLDDKTNEDGEAEFRVDACTNCQTIKIEVKTIKENTQSALANFVMQPFDAENGPLIVLRQWTSGKLKVGGKSKIETYRKGDDKAAVFSFVVVSRGRILSHHTTEVLEDSFKSDIKSLSLHVTPEMSPSARLIVYYIDSSGRVVADSILLKVEEKLPTTVEFDYEIKDGSGPQNKVETQPAKNYVIKLRAPKGTRLGLLGVDKSVYLLRNENRLSKERVLKTAKELDLGCGVGGGKNNRDIFKRAGVVIMTDNFVSDGRNGHDCDEDGSRRKRRSVADPVLKICCEWGREAGGNVTCAKLSLDANKNLPDDCREAFWNCCVEKYGRNDSALLGRSGTENIENAERDLADAEKRTDFPETWIWEELPVGEDGTAKMEATIPDTITTWVIQAVAISNTTGLGLALPLQIVSKKDFFVSLKMPYSVKRGEQISILATVFNYMIKNDNQYRAKVYLRGNKDFCSTAADDSLVLIGILYLQPNDAKSVAVPIIPKTAREIEIEVSSILEVKKEGEVFWDTRGVDVVQRKLLVVPEGKENRTSRSFTLDPKGILNDDTNNGEHSSTISPRNITIDFEIPPKAITGSTGAVVYLTGNLLGPAINTTIEGGLEKFFRQPTGCGEQTMLYLAPNVYVLEYLTNTKQISDPNAESAYRFIQSGYRRELNYRRNDRSFSAFGNERPGSTWLTAFVMRVFCKAKKFLGDEMDERMLCQSVGWLVENQRSDGAFPEVHHVIHREMVGGVYNSEGDVAMTAFVLSALAECKCEVVSQAHVLRATNFLESQYKNLNRPYSMALVAYALGLVDSREKVNANDRLLQKAQYDDVKKTRHWNSGGNALDVETAGYGLMTQLLLGRTSSAGPIVTYITSQRQGGVGFVSTQDTVVALQALALYSEKTTGNMLDLKVEVKTENGEVRESHRINSENALLRREVKIPKGALPGKLFVKAEGSGVGLLEVETRYNLPSSRGEICMFELRVKVVEIKGGEKEDLLGPMQSDAEDKERQEEEKKRKRNSKRGGKRRNKGKRCKRIRDKRKKKQCRNRGNRKGNPETVKKPQRPQKYQPVKNIKLKVCARYKKPGNTGMAIMDIGILTGFKPNKKSLAKLNTSVPQLDMIEKSDRSLVLYLSEIPSTRELCVSVLFEKEFYVGAVQAVPVNVYDYYEPDQSCSVFYGPEKSSPLRLGVCDIGSTSCKCTQDKCPQDDPPIDNIDKLIKIACTNYQYIIKGKLLEIDEVQTMLEYDFEVVQIIQEGNKKIGSNKDDKIKRIEVMKQGTCRGIKLKVDKEYLIMGRDEGGKYELDENSFVKLWPEDGENKVKLDKFSREYKCS